MKRWVNEIRFHCFFESFIYEKEAPKGAPRYIIIYHRQAVWCGEDTELSGHLQMMILSQTFANVAEHRNPRRCPWKRRLTDDTFCREAAGIPPSGRLA